MSLTLSERMVWHDLHVFFRHVRGYPMSETDTNNNWQQFPPGINSTFCGMTGCLNVDSLPRPLRDDTPLSATPDAIIDFLFRIMSVVMNLFPRASPMNYPDASQVFSTNQAPPNLFVQMLQAFPMCALSSGSSSFLEGVSYPRGGRFAVSVPTEPPLNTKTFPSKKVKETSSTSDVASTMAVSLPTQNGTDVNSAEPFASTLPTRPDTAVEASEAISIEKSPPISPMTLQPFVAMTDQPSTNRPEITTDTTGPFSSKSHPVSPMTLHPSLTGVDQPFRTRLDIITSTPGAFFSNISTGKCRPVSPLTLPPANTTSGQSSTTTFDLPSIPRSDSPDEVAYERNHSHPDTTLYSPVTNGQSFRTGQRFTTTTPGAISREESTRSSRIDFPQTIRPTLTKHQPSTLSAVRTTFPSSPRLPTTQTSSLFMDDDHNGASRSDDGDDDDDNVIHDDPDDDLDDYDDDDDDLDDWQ